MPRSPAAYQSSSPELAERETAEEVGRTADLEIGWGYAKQVDIVGDDCSSRRRPLTAE
jgi:hypothetical protein